MILDDLGDYLSSGGIGTVGSTGNYGIFLGSLPAWPEKAVAIYETGGFSSIHAMSTGPGAAVVERPRVQVVVRAPSYSTGRQKAQDVYRRMDGLRERTINGVRYLWAASVQSPFLMGRDENDRPLIACNYDVMKVLSTA